MADLEKLDFKQFKEVLNGYSSLNSNAVELILTALRKAKTQEHDNPYFYSAILQEIENKPLNELLDNNNNFSPKILNQAQIKSITFKRIEDLKFQKKNVKKEDTIVSNILTKEKIEEFQKYSQKVIESYDSLSNSQKESLSKIVSDNLSSNSILDRFLNKTFTKEDEQTDLGKILMGSTQKGEVDKTKCDDLVKLRNLMFETLDPSSLDFSSHQTTTKVILELFKNIPGYSQEEIEAIASDVVVSIFKSKNPKETFTKIHNELVEKHKSFNKLNSSKENYLNILETPLDKVKITSTLPSEISEDDILEALESNMPLGENDKKIKNFSSISDKEFSPMLDFQEEIIVQEQELLHVEEIQTESKQTLEKQVPEVPSKFSLKDRVIGFINRFVKKQSQLTSENIDAMHKLNNNESLPAEEKNSFANSFGKAVKSFQDLFHINKAPTPLVPAPIQKPIVNNTVESQKANPFAITEDSKKKLASTVQTKKESANNINVLSANTIKTTDDEQR